MQWSDGLHEMGYPKWQLVVCLIMIYSLLYVSLFKGVGKVVWVTATMPYVVLTILLVRGLMLPGALSGISYYLKPELSKLKETQVIIVIMVHNTLVSFRLVQDKSYKICS